MDILIPQVEKYRGKIEVLIFWNNFEHSVGFLRQKMNEDARGEYITHIDDDDLIPEDYCKTLYGLMDGVDYIGFNVQLINDGITLPPVYHSLKYDHWSQDDKGYYRGVTHLNPLKKSIALLATYPEKDNGEDYEWTVGVHRAMAGKPFTEHYIDKIMYHYDHFGHDPMPKLAEDKEPKRPQYKSKYIRFHELSTK